MIRSKSNEHRRPASKRRRYPGSSHTDLRDDLTAMVVRDLLGPAGGPEEVLDQYEDHVYQRYLVGMLAPQGSEVAGGELDELSASDGEEGAPESGVPAGSTLFPSSMGLSFVVAAEAIAIVVEAEWDHYRCVKSEQQQQKEDAPAGIWLRGHPGPHWLPRIARHPDQSP